MYHIYVCNNCINNDDCLLKSSKNKVFQQHRHAGKRCVEKVCWPPSLQYFFFLQGIIHSNTLNVYIFQNTFVYKYITKWNKLGIKICIMHFASSLLRIYLAKQNFQEYLYGVLLVLARCCFYHLVDNSILYKKRYTALLCRTNTFLIKWNHMVGGGRKSRRSILFGARSEKPKILFGARGEKRKIYLVPNDSYEKFYLAVKGLNMALTKFYLKCGVQLYLL